MLPRAWLVLPALIKWQLPPLLSALKIDVHLLASRATAGCRVAQLCRSPDVPGRFEEKGLEKSNKCLRSPEGDASQGYHTS